MRLETAEARLFDNLSLWPSRPIRQAWPTIVMRVPPRDRALSVAIRLSNRNAASGVSSALSNSKSRVSGSRRAAGGRGGGGAGGGDGSGVRVGGGTSMQHPAAEVGAPCKYSPPKTARLAAVITAKAR